MTTPVTFSEEVMQSFPVYHLIALESDVITSQYNGSYKNVRFNGTIVYDDVVYDHIEYKIRGEWSTYISGKNKWKLFFTRGHDFQGRDDYGEKYDIRWRVTNLSSLSVPWPETNRGMAIDEALVFAMSNLGGVPSPKTNFFQFRIIDDSVETNPSDQYDGDLWGLYMTIEYPDGRFLDEHGLPDGNTYKREGAPDKKNQGPTQPADNSDINALISGDNTANTVAWWKTNVNLDRYYTFRSINRVVNNMDFGDTANLYQYHNPETDLWTVIAWDMDMLYVPTTHYGGHMDFQNCLSHAEFLIGYMNRGREIQDLLLNSGQLSQLIDELAEIVNPQGQALTMVDVDQFMWNYHPRTTSKHRGAYYKNPGTPQDWPHVTRTLVSADHEGMMQWLKDFMMAGPGGGSDPSSYGYDFLDSEVSDSAIPDTPTATATCGPDYPINGLTFEASAFSDPQGAGTFGAVQWRIAEITDPCNPKDTDDGPHRYEIESAWESGDITDPCQIDILIAASNLKVGHTYRVRCRMKDSSGRCSHWSAPIELVTGEPLAVPIIKDLRITELMYDPAGGSDYEFIELKNTGTETLDLSNVSFTDGVDFAFSMMSFSSRFDDNAEGFIYADSMFDAVENSAYEDGSYLINGGYQGGGLEIFLGPGTGSSMSNLSGGWSNDFVLSSAATATVSFRYRLVMGAGYESNEYSRVILVINGVHYGDYGSGLTKGIVEKWGNGNGGGNDDYGWITYSIDIPLASGAHTITLGGYTWRVSNDQEWTEIFFDDVLITLATFDLGPGEFTLVVGNQGAFESRYGTGLNIAGQYSGKFDNDGEIVELVDFWYGTIAEFEYNDARGWPLAADGADHSLVPLDSAIPDEPNESLSYGRNWRASTYINGSPGADDPAPVTSVVLNEIMAHTDLNDPCYPEYDSNDWIELYNTTGSGVTLTDWYLSDDKNDLNKWVVPGGIGGNSRVSFDEVTGFHNPLGTGFGINKDGEEIYLSYLPGPGADRVVDCVRFKGQENNVSLGRYPDGGEFWFKMPTTRDGANVMPNQPAIVIDEIMYHPTDTNEEYLELYNPTGGSVTLEETAGTWRLRGIGNNDYYFPSGFSISSDGRLIMVGFDPVAEPTRLNAFEATYSTGVLTPGVDIVGPWDGDLSNGGERVALEKPQASDDPCDPGNISWIIVDEVIYFDQSPWPSAPDGLGGALQRVSTAADESGNDPANWTAEAPSPGAAQAP